jgi:hypothetical protein
LARSRIDAHTALVPVACATSLFSCMRPTMSKLRYAASWSTGTGGSGDESGGAEQADLLALQRPIRRWRRRIGCFASAPAIASTAAVPEALSSAPRWARPASSRDASDPLCAARPR